MYSAWITDCKGYQLAFDAFCYFRVSEHSYQLSIVQKLFSSQKD